MNYIAQEVLKNYKYLKNEAQNFEPVKPSDTRVIQRGLNASRQATRNEEFVHPTPIMKNALVICGDVKQTQDQNGEWSTEKFRAGNVSKAQKLIIEILEKAMKLEFGDPVTEYDLTKPFTDVSYYYVDCWNGLETIKEKFWDIVPDMGEQVEKIMKDHYSKQRTNLSIDEMEKLIMSDPTLQIALEVENKMWPNTRANGDIVKISDPFIAKASGVSYPDYHNDRTHVDPNDPSSITWGQYEIDRAKEAYAKGLKYFITWLYDWAAQTLYMRRQRGKGRALIALSRRTNLGLNMVNGVEMSNVKNSYYIKASFEDEEGLLKELSETAEAALKNGLLPVNIDSKAWDANLGAGVIMMQNAERLTLAKGNLTKEIIKVRNNVTLKSWVVDGLANKIYKIYGRMTSGSDDTALGNTKANRTISTASAIAVDKSYVNDIMVPMHYRHVLTLGDDLLVVLRDYGMIEKFIDHITETYGIVIHKDEKFALGIMFLQWRLFSIDGKYVMAYNIPRVVRSALSKEDAKHLGRGGWTFAFWQQLSKLRRYPKALKIAVNILAAFDQHHLSLEVPVQDLIKMVNQEDELAASLGVRDSTAERMFRSNPNIAGLQEVDGKVTLDGNYFSKLQSEMLAVYDPQYLPKLGFENPDLSKVK